MLKCSTRISFKLTNLHQSLPTMPVLSGLLYLTIEDSPGLNQEWKNAENVFLPGNGLEKFDAFNSGSDDLGVAQLLEWMIPNAVETLRHFYIDNNTRIGSIPRQLLSFRTLRSIEITSNRQQGC